MSLSPGLSKKTNSIIWYDPSSSVDSRFGLQYVVRDYIPGQKTTPDTEVNESFHFSPGGSFPLPSTIFYQDAPFPSSELEREPEDTPTQLEPAGGTVVDTLTCLSNMNIDNNKNNNNNNNKRKAETQPSTSKKSSIKYTY